MPLFLSVLVSQKPVWRDHSFLKRQAAPAALTRFRQPHPKRLYNFTSSPRPRRSLTCGGGRKGGTQLPPPSVAFITHDSGGKSPMSKLLVNPADKDTQHVGVREVK
ncbi:hypothetical protein JOB18_000233 [Solea senegalensis]|uniref:Uncharacterized protein n=1 Tax=Solea senegalensis TaxID=28829 RepID=A0AAV6R8C6_SOLSE|nr:hypothetical protein JOB18_000233 [Solea senegalensis]